MTRPVRILLVDDHAIVLDGLSVLLRSIEGFEVVGRVTSGAAALDFIRTAVPDIAVVDVSMPGLSGIALAKRIAADWPKVRVVLLTGQEDRTYLELGLQSGVHGYVLKRSVAENLVQAIRIAVSGGIYIDPTLSGTAVRSVFRPKAPSLSDTPSQLSAREVEVLSLTAKGLTNKEIAAHLRLSVKTIDTFKARAMSKCGFKSRAEIYCYAVAQGWLDGT